MNKTYLTQGKPLESPAQHPKVSGFFRYFCAKTAVYPLQSR
jgi:hypothetical protein